MCVYVYRYAGQNDQLVTASQCLLVISETWHLLNELIFGFDFLNVDRHEGKALLFPKMLVSNYIEVFFNCQYLFIVLISDINERDKLAMHESALAQPNLSIH